MKNNRRPPLISFSAFAVAPLIAACLLLFGSPAQAQSTISNLYPNGTNMFQPSTTLSFTASSPAGVTNVTVALTVTSLYKGTSFLKNLGGGNGLTTNGPGTALSVSTALTSNTLYSAVIQVTDANGNVASQSITFDTITPSYTWEAEDWNYTSNGVSGLFIDNPQTNGYSGLLTTDGVDAHNANGPSPYRIGGDAGGGGLATEAVSPPESNYKRLQYIGTGKTDYDVGYTDGGDFGNYTRTFPAGTYNLFVRASGGNGPKTEAADVTVTSGNATVSSPSSGPYKFGVKGNGWQNFDFMPVTDSGGNLIQITFDGTPSSLEFLQNQANDNLSFFMLMPLNLNEAATTVTITNIYPDGARQFEWTNLFSFTAHSSAGGITPGNVFVQLAVTNLAGVGYVTNLTSGNGLSVTGNGTDITVTAPLTSNTVYTAVIQVTDGNGIPASATLTFDTVIPTYTFEAEDWDYNSGQFFDNPQTNAYYALDGVAGVDFNDPGNTHTAYIRAGLGSEGLNEVPRLQYINTTNQFGVPYQDYDVGFTAGGQWANYTRDYPAGVYNIYVRVSRGDAGSVSDAGSISLVTSGLGTTTQTTTKLGTYNVNSTGNWGKYYWTPVKDTGGNLSRFTADGSVKTLRITLDGAGHNLNYVLLVPADLSVTPPPFVSNFTPDSSALFQFTNTSTFVVNSTVGIPNSGVTVNLDGANVTALTFSGTANALNVSYPVKTNAFHTAIITVTDAVGTTHYTNSFATYSSDNYQWEAEDYDYGGGQFFDNQINAYAGLASVSGVDIIESDPNGTYTYRPAPGIPTGTGDLGGELPRAQFTSGGGSGIDYNLGFFGPNSWANYTHHYPAGTYNVVARVAEGNNPTEDILYQVTSGAGTANQTTNMLGTFLIQVSGWSSWRWSPLVDANGKPVTVTLDGTQKTFRLGGSLLGHDEANVGFLMLAPAVAPANGVTITPSLSSGSIVLSFPTQNGFHYQVQYKNNLSDPSWTPLGSLLQGNGAVQSANDTVTGSTRFYRVQIQ
ncbi:MAG TPA: hypothetical protein VG938_00805 [Verrucomicrobiae bacterium]|nr:hypothetical protein [Verrucomicrobiae bacterium]